MPITIGIGFKGKNVAAEKRAKKHAAKKIKGISAKTRGAIRDVIQRSIRDGIPPYDAARLIMSLVGLTTPQAMAVLNYRNTMIDSGLPIGRVDQLVKRYAEKKLRERAFNIARTEIMDALQMGALDEWKDAQKEGLLGKKATKQAMATMDKRTCQDCEATNGQVQPLDKPFQTPRGPYMMPPFHTRCRCSAAVRP